MHEFTRPGATSTEWLNNSKRLRISVLKFQNSASRGRVDVFNTTVCSFTVFVESAYDNFFQLFSYLTHKMLKILAH